MYSATPNVAPLKRSLQVINLTQLLTMAATRMIKLMSSNSLNGNLTRIETVRISNHLVRRTKWRVWREDKDKVRYNTKIKSTKKARETTITILIMTRTLIVRVMMSSLCLISSELVRSIKCRGIPPSSKDQANLHMVWNTTKNSDINRTIAMILKKSAKKTSMDPTLKMNHQRNLSSSLCQQLALERKVGFING